MPIKNYSTTVDVGKTVGQIQRVLVQAGARSIMSDFGEDGVMESVSFRIVTPDSDLAYRLPANITGVLRCLEKQRVPSRFATREHAARVAWRIIKDWVAAQMAIIEAEMVDARQVFLPYMVTKGGETVYELFEKRGSKLLTEG